MLRLGSRESSFSQRKISRDLDDRGNDVRRACYAEDKARDESRKMCVFPNTKDSERPIDGYGQEREKKPNFRQRLDLIDLTPERIDRKSRNEAKINAKAPSAHAERFALYKE